MKNTTQKIEQFDRPTLRLIDNEMLKAVQGVAEKFGFTIRASGGNFDQYEATLKFECKIDNATARRDLAKSDEATWKQFCPLFDLKPEWFGRSFTQHSKTFTIRALNVNRPKYPVSVVDQHGKTYKFSAPLIAVLLAGDSK